MREFKKFPPFLVFTVVLLQGICLQGIWANLAMSMPPVDPQPDKSACIHKGDEDGIWQEMIDDLKEKLNSRKGATEIIVTKDKRISDATAPTDFDDTPLGKYQLKYSYKIALGEGQVATTNGNSIYDSNCNEKLRIRLPSKSSAGQSRGQAN